MQQEGFYPNPVPLKRPSLLVLAAISLLLALPSAPRKAVLTDSTISGFFQAYPERRRLPRWVQHAAVVPYGTIITFLWEISGHPNTIRTQVATQQPSLHALWLQTAHPIRAGPSFYSVHAPDHNTITNQQR